MAYQGHTQSVGFREYATPDSSSRMRKKAKEIRQKGNTEISRMKQQAADGIQDLIRVTNIDTNNDSYHLRQLQQLNKDMLGFATKLTDEKGPIQAYIEKKRIEGVEEHDNPSEETEKKLALNTEQVKQIEEDVREQATKTGIALDKIETNAKLQNYKLSLEEKARLLNARKLGSNIYWGYKRAHLQSAAEGFAAWHTEQVNQSDEEIEITVDGQTQNVKVNSYYNDGSDYYRRRAIDKYLKNQYVNTHGGTINPQIVNELLTKPISTYTKKLHQVDLQKDIRIQADKEQFDITNSFKQNLSSANFDGALSDLQTMLNTLVSIKRRQGYTRPGQEARKTLQNIINESYSSLDKGTNNNEATLTELGIRLSETKFDIPGQGKQNLATWLGISTNDLIAKAKIFQSAEYTQTQTSLRAQMLEKVGNAKDEYRLTGDADAYQATFQQLYEEFDGKGFDGLQAMHTNHANWKPTYLNEEDSKKQLEILKKEYHINGKNTPIPLSRTLNLNTKVREEALKDGTIAENGFASSQLGIQKRGEAEKNLYAILKHHRKISEKSTIEPPDLVAAKEQALITLEDQAKKLHTLGSYIPIGGGPDDAIQITSEEHAIQVAGQQLVNLIKTQNDPTQKSVGIWTASPTGGYTQIYTTPKADIQQSPNNRLARWNASRDKLKLERDNTSEDIFAKKIEDIDPDLLELNFDGSPKEYYKLLTKIDPKKRSAHELFNLQREAHKLPPVTWSKEQQLVIEKYNQQNPQIKADLSSGNASRISRATEKLGLLDLRSLHNAVLGSKINIMPGDLASKLQQAGISPEEYRTPSGKVKYLRGELNRLMGIAVTKTDNKDIAIRMVAAGLINGEDEMDNWNIPATGSILTNYYSGANHLPTPLLYSDVNTAANQPDSAADDIYDGIPGIETIFMGGGGF